jgi:PhnB protein
MTQINAYINFNGKCREAMTFYQECLGGDLMLQTIEGSPIEAHCPSEMKNQIMHSALTKDRLLLMASDMSGPGGYTHGNSVVLSLNCSSEEEIHTFYIKLSEGGQILDPLKVQFWGAWFGVFDDKFGVRWMLIYDENQKND